MTKTKLEDLYKIIKEIEDEKKQQTELAYELSDYMSKYLDEYMHLGRSLKLPTEYTAFDPIEEKPYDKYYWIKSETYEIDKVLIKDKYAVVRSYRLMTEYGHHDVMKQRLDLIDLETKEIIPILIGDIISFFKKEYKIDYDFDVLDEKIVIKYKFTSRIRPASTWQKEETTEIYKDFLKK
ncbi:MAG: hypothetical protein KatS3mg002_0080 [Candidatus Woesearchaeota archaeon]|nr:MAG: hypothetical protein KatS3mg002_0080 [Candidatus Woesearchaeota archaeon]